MTKNPKPKVKTIRLTHCALCEIKISSIHLSLAEKENLTKIFLAKPTQEDENSIKWIHAEN